MLLFALLTLAYSCSDNAVTTDNSTTYDELSINGHIFFEYDTSGYYKYSDTTKGYYNVSAFAQWPPMGPASANSKLILKKEGYRMAADYKLIVPANGSYTITASYIKLPYASGSVYGLGKYKSDTSHIPSVIFDTTNARVNISGNKGVGDINFLGFIDTIHYIYKF
jgi:hypothetical protein